MCAIALPQILSPLDFQPGPTLNATRLHKNMTLAQRGHNFLS